MLLYKTLREDFFINKLRVFIKEELGEFFLSSVTTDLEEAFKLSEPTKPILFVLSPGDDPQDELKKFSQEKSRVLTTISLGKG